MAAKILICDDDEGILDLVDMVLSEEGFDTVAEINSLNLTARIESEKPDVLVLDLWMPVLSGDQILKALRGQPATHDLPVLVISASNDGRMIAMNAGASDFLPKPFDLDQLVNRVRLLVA